MARRWRAPSQLRAKSQMSHSKRQLHLWLHLTQVMVLPSSAERVCICTNEASLCPHFSQTIAVRSSTLIGATGFFSGTKQSSSRTTGCGETGRRKGHLQQNCSISALTRRSSNKLLHSGQNSIQNNGTKPRFRYFVLKSGSRCVCSSRCLSLV
jgi:hypothetical protein